MTRTKTLVNNLLMSNFLWKSSLKHKSCIFEIVIKTANPAKTCAQKILHTRTNFTYTKLPRWIYFLKNAKKTCKPNNRDNLYWNSMRECLPDSRLWRFGHLERMEENALCSKYRTLKVSGWKVSKGLSKNRNIWKSFTRKCLTQASMENRH